jgi:Aldo/keto reductase family
LAGPGRRRLARGPSQRGRTFADECGGTPAQLALAWLLAQGDDVVPIPGTKRIDRLEENAAAAVTLSEADLDRLESVALRSAWAGDRVAFASHRETRTQAEMFHAPKAKAALACRSRPSQGM